MTYPPHPGNWSDPANPPADPGQAPTYLDPISGQPVAVSPAPAQPYPAAPGYPAYPADQTVPAYPADPRPAAPQPGYPTTPYGYEAAPGYPAVADPYGGGQAYAYPGYMTPPMPGGRTNGLSIAAMVISIVGMVSLSCYGVGGIILGTLGAIFGHVSRKQIRERGEAGAGMALAGIIVGWIAVGLGLVIVAVVIGFVVWAANTTNSTYTPDPYST